MKKTIIPSLAIFFLIFAFFIPRADAEDKFPLLDEEAAISMDFQNAELKDLLKVFSIQAGMNFIASEAVQDRKITLYLDKVPLSQAMDKIFSANNLSYELDSDANIFIVKEWGKMETETVTKIFYLKHATVSVSSLKEEMAKSIGSPSVNSSSRSKFREEGEGGITSAIKKILSSSGTLIEDFRTNSIIVTDTPMKMKVISQVVEALDVPVPQVMLEVEMLDVSKNTVDRMGIEFGDSPFTAVFSGAAAATGFPYAKMAKLINTSEGVLTMDYDMQLDFIRTQTDTKYLARPKLLTLNNETAELFITKDEIVGKVETPGTQTSAPTVNYTRSTDLVLTKEGTGIYLRVTPQINLDTNEITMVINPKSSVSNVSSVSTTENPQSDVEIRSTKSIVKVKDGETVILGGLIHQDRNVSLKKLPILGDIPILGALFRHKDKTVDRERELIVFITPHIIREKADIKFGQVPNVQLPVREQGIASGANRDFIINANMNKFEKSINGQR